LFANDLKRDDTKEEAMKKIAILRIYVWLVSLGLNEVKDTFVGDTNVRGVSGGQRRRVTVGEMLMNSSPVLCGDEISTGLDAASTYDMCEVLCHLGRLQKFTRIISLLQPVCMNYHLIRWPRFKT
jgi:ABC-type multidrug transport system ATPase subunit